MQAEKIELKNVVVGSGGLFVTFAEIFYQPARAFAHLQTRSHAWLPMFLVVMSSSILLLWYFDAVDFSWLTDQMNAGIDDVAARERARKIISKGLLKGMAMAGTIIGLPFVTVLEGLYLMLVGKILSKDFSFGKGFALSAWSSIPNLLLLPLGAIQILMSSNGQMSSSELNPFSINQMFFHYGMTYPLTGPLDILSITTIWGIGLMVIGFEVWAKVTRATALKVVLIPYVVVFGLWFAFALSGAA